MDPSTGKPRELALFAGAGGGIWGSRLLGWRTVGYVEKDEYCQRVLQARIRDGLFDDAPIWDDVRTFNGRPWCGHVDVLTAGFPCQPFSVAGKQAGADDPRNMWPDTIRILTEVRPQAALLENVPGLLAGSHGYFGQILGDLVESGFDAEWCVLGADDVGAPHRRKRLWVLAYPSKNGRRNVPSQHTKSREFGREETETERLFSNLVETSRSISAIVAYPVSPGLEKRERKPGNHGQECPTTERGCQISHPAQVGCGTRRTGRSVGGCQGLYATETTLDDSENAHGRGLPDSEQSGRGAPEVGRPGWWAVEPALGRVAHGVADRVNRLRALGNGQVPAVVARAWEVLNAKTTTNP